MIMHHMDMFFNHSQISMLENVQILIVGFLGLLAGLGGWSYGAVKSVLGIKHGSGAIL